MVCVQDRCPGDAKRGAALCAIRCVAPGLYVGEYSRGKTSPGRRRSVVGLRNHGKVF